MTRIRADRPTDAHAVWTVHEAAFGRPDEGRLAARLRQEASPIVSLVAEQASRVIAHVLFSPVAVEGDRPSRSAASAGALGPVGVVPDAQARGAGSALIRAGIAACRALDWQLLFVLGAPSYYARFGFALAAPHGLHYASHDFDVAFQVLELTPRALAGARGWVRYHAAFAEMS